MALPPGRVFAVVRGPEETGRGAPPVKVQATIQRLMHEEGKFPYIVFRTRDTEGILNGESEWGWSRDVDDAYVFPMLERPLVSGADDYARSAEVHVAALKAKEALNAWPCVHGEAAQFESRERRRRDREAKLEASVREFAAGDAVAQEPAQSAPVVPSAPPEKKKLNHNERRRHFGRRREPIDPHDVFERNEREHLA